MIENQILKLKKFTIVFLSQYCFAITKDLEKLLKMESISLIPQNNRLNKTNNLVGAVNFHVKIHKDTELVTIQGKKYSLIQLINSSTTFEDINLSNPSKFLTFKKGNNHFVSISQNTYIFLNKHNVIQKNTLESYIYFRDITIHDFTEKKKVLFKLDLPISHFIFDNKLTDMKLDNITIKNDLSDTNAFYFLDEDIKISNTGAKPILTYGFSKNNTLNYFDVSNINNFNDFKNFLTSNLNYNKYFKYHYSKEMTKDFFIRKIQFNLLSQIYFIDYDELKKFEFEENNYLFDIIVKYTQLRHMLIPTLYSAFKEQRINNVRIYNNSKNQIIFNNQLLYVPVFTGVDSQINQKALNINIDDIYYDFHTGEKFTKNTFQFYTLDKMPLFVKKGSIIPLSKKESEYSVNIYPGCDKEYLLHYDDYIKNNSIHYAFSKFNLIYAQTKIKLTITPHSILDLLPNKISLNFINLKHTSIVKVDGSEFEVDYNIENKILVIHLKDLSNVIKVDIENISGLEMERSMEFYNKKLEDFFDNLNCNEKENQIYKYKIKPYLHESLDILQIRINKHLKFINSNNRKKLIKMLELYKS